ncbi:hypothetical protein [Delftia phage IME-DE1]|uniref:Uncharacterized protein n=1 Tax=Delftia phage IME-DE1 TaxID=1647385 RepID=A0A0F7INI0_9CAUD|nr:hypothetical protein AU155_gp37 [Delftia phage IME-DE1]AKG94500.1 hypothetical protein [Delftia phage IME-DE1]
MTKRNLSFAIAIAATASLNVPEDVWAKAKADTVEALKAVRDDEDGALWGAAVSGQHNLDEGSFRILEGALEDSGGDLDAAAELALIRSITRGTRTELKAHLEREDLTRVQVSFKMTPKSNTITNEQKEAK